MTELYYVGEIGRTISLTTGFDWTGAVTKEVTIKTPDGTLRSFTGSSVSVDDAATGQIHISTIAGTLDQTGEYFFQAKMATASVTRYSGIFSFFVETADLTGTVSAGTVTGDITLTVKGTGVILTNAAGTVTKRVRLNDTGDGLIYETP